MDDLSFLQEAVMVQIIKLLQLLDVQDLPYTIYCRADEELNKLYDYAVKNNIYLPCDIHVHVNYREFM